MTREYVQPALKTARIRSFFRGLDSSDDPLETSHKNSVTKRRIAIVEDLSELLSLYSRALQMYGHEVVLAATNGREAVEASVQGKLSGVEFMIIDYSMPELNGLEAARAIVTHDPGVRVIIASADDTIERETKAVGFKFLRKPFTISELMSCIE